MIQWCLQFQGQVLIVIREIRDFGIICLSIKAKKISRNPN